MADCGAILNTSVFPECLWLIWHFSLNPSRCLCSLQLFRSPSQLCFHLSLAFQQSNSRLPLFKHLPSPFSYSFCAQVSQFFHLFKHSCGFRLLRCKWMYNIPSTASEVTLTACLSNSFCPHVAETVTPARFFVVALPAAAVCFQLIKFGM